MASFKTHLSFGAIIGIAIIIIVSIYSLVSNHNLLPILFFAAVLGSFLPDLDSDEGLPFQIIFGVFSLIGTGIAFYSFYQKNPKNYTTLIIATLIAFILLRFVLGALFKKFTHHRGIFHSIPALFAATFAALLSADRFNISPQDKILIAATIGLGFLSHLILDEVKSFVNFRGVIFSPKKSLGSALKFFSDSKIANIAIYALLAILIYLNYPMIVKISHFVSKTLDHTTLAFLSA